MNKKIFFVIVIVLVLIMILILWSYMGANKKLSWNNMQIKDFEIYSYKDRWENYPFPAEKINSNLITKIIPDIGDNIEEIEVYKWKINDEVYSFIYVVQLKNKLSKITEGSNIGLSKKNILNEDVYNYDIPIDYEGKKETMHLYFFDEDKFIFIVGGFWSFSDDLTKKLIDKYPSNPTSSNFNINPYNQENIINQITHYI